LFLEATRDVAKQHPRIVYDERIVDAVCMHLVMKPEQFDILVLPNLYGDIVSAATSRIRSRCCSRPC
jgi:isocitrate/isopropylmalate dehydrogenase